MNRNDDDDLMIYLEDDRVITFKDLQMLDDEVKFPPTAITEENFKNDKITFKEYAYLKELICLYSDLALSRNYLWKTFLQKIFSR